MRKPQPEHLRYLPYLHLRQIPRYCLRHLILRPTTNSKVATLTADKLTSHLFTFFLVSFRVFHHVFAIDTDKDQSIPRNFFHYDYYCYSFFKVYFLSSPKVRLNLQVSILTTDSHRQSSDFR